MKKLPINNIIFSVKYLCQIKKKNHVIVSSIHLRSLTARAFIFMVSPHNNIFTKKTDYTNNMIDTVRLSNLIIA